MKDMAPKGEQDMYLIRSECSFDAAHFLKGYSGKCRNLHGHRWRVVAELKGECIRRNPVAAFAAVSGHGAERVAGVLGV